MHATKIACFSKTASMHGVIAADRTPEESFKQTFLEVAQDTIFTPA
jgi:hypothetical protein